MPYTLTERIQIQIETLHQQAANKRAHYSGVSPRALIELERADAFETVAGWLSEILEMDRQQNQPEPSTFDTFSQSDDGRAFIASLPINDA